MSIPEAHSTECIDLTATDTNHTIDSMSLSESQKSRKVSIHSWDRLLSDKIENKFKCKLCSYSSPWQRYLQDHIRGTHSNEKDYQCEICHKKFTRFASLGVHRRKHTQEKPYGCVHCGRRFHVSRQLLRHVEMRLCWMNSRMPPNMRFECTSCSAVFGSRSYLDRHCRLIHDEGQRINPMNPLLNPNGMTLKVEIGATASNAELPSDMPPLEPEVKQEN